jgi:cyanophycinase
LPARKKSVKAPPIEDRAPHGAKLLRTFPPQAKGTLIAIGGAEAKDGDRPILEEVARRAGAGPLVVATIATEDPEGQFEQYRKVFRGLNVKDVVHLDARSRDELLDPAKAELMDNAKAVFLGGGDQLKIASTLGGTVVCDRLRKVLMDGGLIAGTSSGASVLTEVMMVSGNGDESHEIRGSLRLAPGLGLIGELIIDQHFAQRGRIGRLIGAVAQNPRVLGLGIDENTACVLEPKRLRVLGEGAVYVLDGREMTYSNTAEETPQTLSAFNIRLHVLSRNDTFDLTNRTPSYGPIEEPSEAARKKADKNE